MAKKETAVKAALIESSHDSGIVTGPQCIRSERLGSPKLTPSEEAPGAGRSEG
jgi:hypothetical protein